MSDELPLVKHAKYELEKTGWLADPDLKFVADGILELIERVAAQDHCYESAMMLNDAFGTLMRFEPLTPLTSEPTEWQDVSEEFDSPGLFQSTRCPNVFSLDGGQTWEYVSGEDEECECGDNCDCGDEECDCPECRQFTQDALNNTPTIH